MAPPASWTFGPYAAPTPSTPLASASSALSQASLPPSVATDQLLASGFPLRSRGSSGSTRIFTIFPPPLLFSCMVGIHVVLASDHSYGDRDIGPYGPSFHQYSSMAPHSSNAAMGHIPGCGLNNHQESPVQGHPLDHSELYSVVSFRSPVHLQSHLLPVCAITSPAPFIIP